MVEHGQGPRSGARDNGLRAAGYVAVGDLDPRIADALLETLRDEGIAAYVTPTPGTRGGYLEVHPPAHLTDRLYADSARAARANELLASEHHQTPGDEAMPGSRSAPAPPPPVAPLGVGAMPGVGGEQPGEIDFDSAWQQVLSSLQSTTAGGDRPWPASEEVEPGAFATPAAGTLDEDPMLDEHFVPPPPPPLPRLRRVTVIGWLSIVAGLFILGTGFEDGSLVWLAVLAIFAGAGTLIWHVKEDRIDDSDSDDGAIV
jgi:hypothetical protein